MVRSIVTTLVLVVFFSFGLAGCSKSECNPVATDGMAAMAALSSDSLENALDPLQRLQEALVSSDTFEFSYLGELAGRLRSTIVEAQRTDLPIEQRDATVYQLSTGIEDFSGTYQNALNLCD